MYNSSSQLQHWKFDDEESIKKIREASNSDYIKNYEPGNLSDAEKSSLYLTLEEAQIIYGYYEYQLKDFCIKFRPYMHKSVIGTAVHYFKRFYLNNSVMDYHPREILVTCAFLACKTEEFHVSLEQFIANVRGSREKAAEIILNLEMIVLNGIKFHLTIHNPYRPVEGYFIDIKTRYPKFDIEILRPHIAEFLDKCLLTDVPLLFTPSQIALASIFHSASRCKENLDSYVTDILVTDQEMLKDIIEAVKTIRQMVRSKNFELPSKDVIMSIEKKLSKCRNPENNPETEIYKDRMRREQELDAGEGEGEDSVL